MQNMGNKRAEEIYEFNVPRFYVRPAETRAKERSRSRVKLAR
jgi:hypothetical protein